MLLLKILLSIWIATFSLIIAYEYPLSVIPRSIKNILMFMSSMILGSAAIVLLWVN